MYDSVVLEADSFATLRNDNQKDNGNYRVLHFVRDDDEKLTTTKATASATTGVLHFVQNDGICWLIGELVC